MMKMIFNAESCASTAVLIDRFKVIYSNGFPDSNEREDFDVIIDRVQGIKSAADPYTIIIISTLDELESEVSGGLIADWYEESKCIHLTYLIIDEKHRRKRIAEGLITKGISQIKNWILLEKGIEIRNVFFESNNPNKTVIDNFDTIQRLEIFSSLGGKLINIPYVQPALGTKKDKVDNLFLLTFSQFNSDPDKIPAKEIYAFLKDLYLGLGCGEPDENLLKMDKSLNELKDKQGFIELENIQELSCYKIPQASVTWHFITDSNKSKCNDSRECANNNNYISSFETDLLNFQNQKTENIPFKSRYIDIFQDAHVIFPRYYMYNSEGQTHHRITERGRLEIKVNLSVSETVIEKSGKKILHLTISPVEGYHFTEIDLIKLSTLFGSIQENSKIKANIKFEDAIKLRIPGNSDEVSITESLHHLCQINKEVELINLNTGILHIESGFMESIHNISQDIFYKMFLNSKKESISKPVNDFSKALCGIILGIFDFNRMDDEEIFDTIRPIVVKDYSFIVLCRGSLLKISKDDEIMEATSQHIIVDPYLLVPNTVLGHNEYILAEAKTKINDSLSTNNDYKLSELESCQSTILHVLNFKVIRNVFQYPSEQEITEVGNFQRGINNLILEITGKLEDLSKLIAIKRANKANNVEAVISAFLLFIALYPLNPFLINYVGGDGKEIYLIIGELLLSAVMYFLVRAKK